VPVSGTPGPRAPISVSVLREAVRKAVAATSTHQTAKAIGLSQGWLRKFLDGAEPYAGTVELLREWHERDTRERALAALETLVDLVAGSEDERVREELLDVLRNAHKRLGTTPPGWLRAR
jgi:hypothetical protein